MARIEHSYGDMCVCPECGNTFIFDETSKFITTDYVCSLSCFNKYQRKHKSVIDTTKLKSDVKKVNPITTSKETPNTDEPVNSTHTDVVKKKRGRPRKNPVDE